MEIKYAAAQNLESSIANFSWEQIEIEAEHLWQRQRIKHLNFSGVYGVPTGGSCVALLVNKVAGLELYDSLKPGSNILVVDDLVDSGRTLQPFADHFVVDALYRKEHSPAAIAPEAKLVKGWVRFPWEHATGAEDSVVRLLQFIGEDPKREGLRDTPTRVLGAWKEMMRGYGQDPKEILSKTFNENIDQMIVLRKVEFHSMCEHHLLPFSGSASVGYIPSQNGLVVGISKLARLVECFASRLQVQERLTNQIADAVHKELKAMGVGVIVRAKHLCMACRGVRKDEAEMVSSCLLGYMRTSEAARNEFIQLVGKV